jgi:YVTN family beta-propeller protein
VGLREVATRILLSMFGVAALLALGGTWPAAGSSPAPPATVIATIPVGLSPAWLAFDTRNGRVYVANIFSDDVSVIDPRTNTVVDTIPLAGGFVCAHPFAVGYDPRHDVVYVACQQYTMATAISGRTNTPIGDPIEVGSSPFGIAFDSRNDHVYIAVAHTQDVAVLDAATRAVIDRVPIPPAPGQSESEPFGIAYDDRNGELYVAESASPEVSVIDGSTNNVLKTIPTPSTTRGIAYDPPTGEIYVANFEAGSVSVIDDTTNDIVATIPVGSFPFGLAYNQRDGDIYVANFGSASLSVIDPKTKRVVKTIPIDGTPVGVATDPRSGNIYVTRGNVVDVLTPLR